MLAGIIVIILLIIGVSLLIKGLQQRYRGDDPHCANCGYNLTGLASERCPECGGTITEPGAVVIGVRHRRPGYIAAGLACLAVIVLVLATPLRNIDWYHLMPTTFVLSDLESSNPVEASRAWKVIDARLKRGALSAGQRSRLIEMSLDEQADQQSRSVTDDLLTFLGQAFLADELDAAQEERFFTQAITCSITVRPRTSPHDPVPGRVKVTHRLGGAALSYVIRTESPRIDDEAREPTFESAVAMGPGSNHFYSSYPHDLDGVSPGRHTLSLRLRLSVYSGGLAQHGSTHYHDVAHREKQWAPSIHDRIVELSAPFEVLSEEPTDYIKRIRVQAGDQSFAAHFPMTSERFLWASFWSKRSNSLVEGWMWREAGWTSPRRRRPLPTHVAADVYVRIDGIEYFVGEAKGTKGEDHMTLDIWGFTGRAEPFDTFDLVLKPNEDIARATTDMDEILDELVVKEDMFATCTGKPDGAEERRQSSASPE